MNKYLKRLLALGVMLCMTSTNVFANNYAACFGGDFQDGGDGKANLNTLPYTNTANRHFTNAGYDATTFSNPSYNMLSKNNDDGVTPRLSSSILFLAG